VVTQTVVDNPTAAADEPQFRVESAKPSRRGEHRRGFESLTVIRNHHNLGGCGGFNTGLAYLEAHLDRAGEPLDYAWLVDDDIDLPTKALDQLLATAERDQTIGLVGSRTVDFADRETTIETTIYFDFDQGWMGPDPVPTHPQHESHNTWVQATGGTRGKLPFSGVRDVDVVSACSLLARWSAVKKVGFWDRRYFIYCDDADWCLRFPKAGYRVVLDLDAVVYHTYWLSKLTPARAYYSQRNLVWLIQKVFSGRKLRKATARRLAALLLESRKAMMHCRLFHAEIIRRTADDIVTARSGKLLDEGPPAVPVMQAFDQVGAWNPGATVLVMCSHPESIKWADDLRLRVRYALSDAGRLADAPTWVYLVRDDVPDPESHGPAIERPERIVFEATRGSKWAAQQPMLHSPPAAVVVFNQHNDFPLLRSKANIHIDQRRPGVAQVEEDGFGPRLSFVRRWLGTALRCAVYSLRVRPFVRTGKYG
jgi:GT2 family glycosyltransferase